MIQTGSHMPHVNRVISAWRPWLKGGFTTMVAAC